MKSVFDLAWVLFLQLYDFFGKITIFKKNKTEMVSYINKFYEAYC